MPNQNLRKLFPEWRLPKGMMKASDEELDRSIESCERWEWFGGGSVFLGVIAAVVIAAVHPQYDSFWEQWGSAVADILVAVGVAAEIIFGQMAGLRQTELRLRSDEKVAEANVIAAQATKAAAEARERTIDAELQLEALRTVVARPLFLIDRFAAELDGKQKANIDMLYIDDPECSWLAGQIFFGLRMAKWSVKYPTPLPVGSAPFKEGSEIFMSSAQRAGASDHGISVIARNFGAQMAVERALSTETTEAHAPAVVLNPCAANICRELRRSELDGNTGLAENKSSGRHRHSNCCRTETATI